MSLIRGFNVKRGDKITLIGGGGKTTTLFNIGLNSSFEDILITTSTKMYKENMKFYREEEFNYERGIITVGKHIDKNNKIIGLDKNKINEICNKNLYDLMLIEGDGSRGKSLKLYKDNEPIIPEKSNKVIVVIGADILNQTRQHIHRYELYNKPVEKINKEIIYNILTSEFGVINKLSNNQENIIYINKWDKFKSKDMIVLGEKLLKLRKINKIVYGSSKENIVYKEMCK